MPQSNAPDSPEASPPDTSFGDILTQFEQSHHAAGEPARLDPFYEELSKVK